MLSRLLQEHEIIIWKLFDLICTVFEKRRPAQIDNLFNSNNCLLHQDYGIGGMLVLLWATAEP